MRPAARSIFALLALLAMAASAESKPSPPKKVYDFSQLEDLNALAGVLRARTAELHVATPRDPNDPLVEPVRELYGVVIGPKHIAAQSLLLGGGKKVEIHGPSGRPVPGIVVLDDRERRVAIIEASRPLAEAGLVPVEIAPLAERKQGTVVFALVNTSPEATVMHGTLIYVGDEPEYGGHHRTDLKLTLGMPVFDSEVRFVGYARAVAWDQDKLMLVTPEMITAARTATGAADREKAHPTPAKKPWWSR